MHGHFFFKHKPNDPKQLNQKKKKQTTTKKKQKTKNKKTKQKKQKTKLMRIEEIDIKT